MNSNIAPWHGCGWPWLLPHALMAQRLHPLPRQHYHISVHEAKSTDFLQVPPTSITCWKVPSLLVPWCSSLESMPLKETVQMSRRLQKGGSCEPWEHPEMNCPHSQGCRHVLGWGSNREWPGHMVTTTLLKASPAWLSLSPCRSKACRRG